MQIVKNIFSRSAFASRGSPFHEASPNKDTYKFQSSLRLQWPTRPSLTAKFPVDFHIVSLLSSSAAPEKTSNILPLFCRGPVKSTRENNESSPFGFRKTTNATLAHNYSSSIVRLIFDRCFFSVFVTFPRATVRPFFTRSGRTDACFPAGCRRPKYQKQFFPCTTFGPGPRWKSPPSSHKSSRHLNASASRPRNPTRHPIRATVGRCDVFPISIQISFDRSTAFTLFGRTLRFKR